MFPTEYTSKQNLGPLRHRLHCVEGSVLRGIAEMAGIHLAHIPYFIETLLFYESRFFSAHLFVSVSFPSVIFQNVLHQLICTVSV